MRTDKQKNILCDCLDMIAIAGFLPTRKERIELAETLINELNNYPFVSAKMRDAVIFAYWKVNCTRNMLRAYISNRVPFHIAFTTAKRELEAAFSILTDK